MCIMGYMLSMRVPWKLIEVTGSVVSKRDLVASISDSNLLFLASLYLTSNTYVGLVKFSMHLDISLSLFYSKIIFFKKSKN
jgi:hypothetical protein